LKTYEYRGFDGNGRASKGLVEAVSVKDAREKLSAEGVLADRVAPARRKARFPAGARAVLYHELSALLGAGLPLVRALDLLMQSPEMAESRVMLAIVRDSVKEGGTLADALAEASGSTTPFEHAIMKVAERSGAVETMLERLAMFLEEQQKLKERIQGALIYPSIVVAAGICVAVLMLGLLIPRATDMLSGSPDGLPVLTRFMLGLGRAILRWGAVVAAVAAGAFLYGRHKASTDEVFQRDWNRRLFRLPLIGRGYTILVALRFARTMSILLQGGVSVVEGVVLAGKATGSSWVAKLSEDASESIRHGSSLSDAVRRIPPLAHSLPGWIQVGEASGGLSRLLENAGRRYQDGWDRFVSRGLAFLEPVLILLIGGFVLLITLAVLLPIISLTRGMG